MNNKRKVFTLVEVLVGIAVFGLIMGAVASLVISSQEAWGKQSANTILIQEGRWALEMISSEIRSARVSTIKTSGFWPSSLNGKRIEFVDRSGTRIRYQRDRVGGTFTNELIRREKIGFFWGPKSKLSIFVVDNPGNGDIFTNASGLVTIFLTLRPFPTRGEGRGNRNFSLRTMVRARNP